VTFLIGFQFEQNPTANCGLSRPFWHLDSEQSHGRYQLVGHGCSKLQSEGFGLLFGNLN